MDKYAVATEAAKTGEREVGWRWAGALHVTGAVTVWSGAYLSILGKYEESGSSCWARIHSANMGQILTNMGMSVFVHIGPYCAHIGTANINPIWTNMGMFRMERIGHVLGTYSQHKYGPNTDKYGYEHICPYCPILYAYWHRQY
jgi:hypothetical protein